MTPTTRPAIAVSASTTSPASPAQAPLPCRHEWEPPDSPKARAPQRAAQRRAPGAQEPAAALLRVRSSWWRLSSYAAGKQAVLWGPPSRLSACSASALAGAGSHGRHRHADGLTVHCRSAVDTMRGGCGSGALLLPRQGVGEEARAHTHHRAHAVQRSLWHSLRHARRSIWLLSTKEQQKAASRRGPRGGACRGAPGAGARRLAALLSDISEH